MIEFVSLISQVIRYLNSSQIKLNLKLNYFWSWVWVLVCQV